MSNINCGKNEINYYDSLFDGKIKDRIKMQVRNLYKCSEDELVIKVRVCQQQTNAVDCGVYAVANTFYMLSNVDISSRQLKESAMRDYHLQCIRVGKFTEFQQSEPIEIVLYYPDRSVKFDVFCTCRFPWV